MPGSRDSSWQPPLFLPPQPDGQYDGGEAHAHHGHASYDEVLPGTLHCLLHSLVGHGGVQHPLHLLHPGQLLVDSLPLLFRQSCASATGCKEDHASSSSLMVEETPGGGLDRGVGGHGGGLE